MTKYLGNNQVGFDARTLGFPSILSCEAFVYQTDAGLYGFHEMPMETGTFELKAAAFARYVQNHAMNHGETARMLYGVINREHRFGASATAAWQAELETLARALGYRGPVCGGRIATHVDKRDSVYVRFDAAGTACDISFKRWSKMTFDPTGTLPADQFEVKRVKATDEQKSDETLLREYWANPNFNLQAPYGLFQPVLRQGRTDEGDLNALTGFEIAFTAT